MPISHGVGFGEVARKRIGLAGADRRIDHAAELMLILRSYGADQQISVRSFAFGMITMCRDHVEMAPDLCARRLWRSGRAPLCRPARAAVFSRALSHVARCGRPAR